MARTYSDWSPLLEGALSAEPSRGRGDAASTIGAAGPGLELGRKVSQTMRHIRSQRTRTPCLGPFLGIPTGNRRSRPHGRLPGRSWEVDRGRQRGRPPGGPQPPGASGVAKGENRWLHQGPPTKDGLASLIIGALEEGYANVRPPRSRGVTELIVTIAFALAVSPARPPDRRGSPCLAHESRARRGARPLASRTRPSP